MLLAKVFILSVGILLCNGLVEPHRNLYHDSTSSRIVGGELAPENYAPFACSLQRGIMSRNHMCGGSIINPRTILTAAHCITPNLNNDKLNAFTFAYCGSNEDRWYGTSYHLRDYVIHEHWDPETIKNDIGLLFTTATIEYIPNRVAPVVLSDDFVDGDRAMVIVGWGRISFSGPISTQLKRLDTNSLSHAGCVAALAQAQETHGWWLGTLPPYDESAELCAHTSPNNAVCYGDSGSPLVIPNTNQQVGLASWTIPCAHSGPDVYTRVGSYIHWINEQLSPSTTPIFTEATTTETVPEII